MIITKAIDTITVGVTVNVYNGIPFINFAYSVYDNLNSETGEYDSWNTYSAICTLNEFSYSFSGNVDTNIIEYLKMTMGSTNYIFSVGEYQDLNGDAFPIQFFIDEINAVLV